MSAAKDLLNEIHETGFKHLFSLDLPKPERLADLKLVRQKLAQVKRKLRDHQKEARSKWDARKGKFEKIMQEKELAPFDLIETVFSDIDLALKELENCLRFDRPLPDSPSVGSVLIETDETIVILSDAQALEYARNRNREAIQRSQHIGKQAKQELAKIQQASFLQKLFRGRKLNERTVELTESLTAAKKLYLHSKVFEKMQTILELPVCIDILPEQYQITIEGKDDAIQELMRLDDVRDQLIQLSKEAHSLPEVVNYIKSHITGIETVQSQLKNIIGNAE